MKNAYFLLAVCFTLSANGQMVLPLYKGVPPGSLNVADKEIFSRPGTGRPVVKNVSRPTLTAFIPQQQNAVRTAVIICPGGGYLNLSIEDGGYEVAKQLADNGIIAFVLKYRTWYDSAYTEYKTIPMQDLQQAMKIVYAGATKWNIDTTHLGLLGFSAGGHLAAMAATSTNSVKPAFTILVYPIISFTDSLTSRTSKTRSTLLGKKPTALDKFNYSPELHVTPSTPPAFIVQAEDDSTSLVGNSVTYYQNLVANKVHCKMLLYQKGGHGFALYNKAEDEYWLPAAIKWLGLNGFYKTGTIKSNINNMP